MNPRWMAVVAAAALVGVGFLAVPALADDDGEDSDSKTTDPHGKGARMKALADERKAIRDEARGEFLGEKAAARDAFHGRLVSIRDAFQACKAGAAALDTMVGNATDNVTDDATDNVTDDATDNATDCKALAREHLADMRQDARHDYRLAKMRAKLAYHEALYDTRPHHGEAFRERCAAEPACVDRVVEKLEDQLARLDNGTADLGAKLANATARHENLSADPNATAREIFKAKDLVFRLQIALLKVERHVFHIESQLAHWHAVQNDPAADQTPDAGSEGFEANEPEDDASDTDEGDASEPDDEDTE